MSKCTKIYLNWWISKQKAASQEEWRSVSDNINWIHTKCTNSSATICECWHHYYWHAEILRNSIGIIGDGLGIS